MALVAFASLSMHPTTADAAPPNGAFAGGAGDAVQHVAHPRYIDLFIAIPGIGQLYMGRITVSNSKIVFVLAQPAWEDMGGGWKPKYETVDEIDRFWLEKGDLAIVFKDVDNNGSVDTFTIYKDNDGDGTHETPYANGNAVMGMV